MKRNRVVAISALAVAVSVGVVAAAGSASAGTTLGALADRSVAAGTPGVIVRVDDGRHPVVNLVRQASWTAPLSANDEFRMGSNTKTITATLILQLVAEHRLGLDDRVEKWLPGAFPIGRAITVRMLLNHTSGLADYAFEFEVLQLMTGHQQNHPPASELLALGTDQPPVAAPGAKFSYSNPGYIALGMILQKVTGHSVADLVEQRIARPLGLRHTFLPTDAATGGLAHAYEPDAAHLAPILPAGLPQGYGFVGPVRHEHVDVTPIDQSWDGAAGSIVSTTSDWARFDTALMSGRLIPAALLKQMRTVVPEDVEDRSYGLGLERYQTPCGTVWGHDGALPGYRSDNYTDLSGRRTVSVLSTTHFGLTVDPVTAAAQKDLVTAAICAMLDKPAPAGS